MTDKPRCPECGENEKIVKAGHRLVIGGKKQRYQCKKCHHTFISCHKTKGTMTPACLEYNDRNDFRCFDCKLVEGDCGKELDQCSREIELYSESCQRCHLHKVVLWARQEHGETMNAAHIEDEAERGYEAMEEEKRMKEVEG